ncbi:MAG: FliM/FliN family flagellar motor switch protein [Terriglobales bacterium]|jgi:flagellar motor switch protein FliN/FliY
MSDGGASNKIKGDFQHWFEAWRNCTQNVLSQVSGKPVVFETILEPLAASDSDQCFTVVAAGSVQGEMSLRLSQNAAVRLARKFLGETEASTAEGGDPKNTEALSNDDREALEEMLRQVAGLAATTAGSELGGEVQLRVSSTEAPWARTSDALASIRTRGEAGTEIAIEIRISPALAHALASHGSAVPRASAAPELRATPGNTATPSFASSSALEPPAAGYQRLLDVGLGVKLRFGTRRMLLRDVLALSSGLVVELDNPLNSPVDLLLDGRVIARGDVVVIDGNYGLRVSEVVEPSPTNTPV